MFRTSQKHIEKEWGTLHTAVNDLTARAQAGEVDPNDAVKAIDGMVKRLETLKRKVRVLRLSDKCWCLQHG